MERTRYGTFICLRWRSPVSIRVNPVPVLFRFFRDHESSMIGPARACTWTRAAESRFQHLNSSCRPIPGDQEVRGDNRMHSMLTLLLQSSIFVAGFLVGYVACAWRYR